MRYKIGQDIKILSNTNSLGRHCDDQSMVGKIGSIMNIDSSSLYPYKVCYGINDGDIYYFHSSDIEPVSDPKKKSFLNEIIELSTPVETDEVIAIKGLIRQAAADKQTYVFINSDQISETTCRYFKNEGFMVSIEHILTEINWG